MLAELGHAVTAAENGMAALERLATPAAFDLLLADFAMPVMNGAELAAAAIKLRPQLSVLFVTGYADVEVLSSWSGIGYGTLNKPFTTEELKAALQHVTRSRPIWVTWLHCRRARRQSRARSGKARASRHPRSSPSIRRRARQKRGRPLRSGKAASEPDAMLSRDRPGRASSASIIAISPAASAWASCWPSEGSLAGAVRCGATG